MFEASSNHRFPVGFHIYSDSRIKPPKASGNTRTPTSSNTARPAGIRKRHIWCQVGVALAARGFLFVLTFR